MAPQRWQENSVDGPFDVVFTFGQRMGTVMTGHVCKLWAILSAVIHQQCGRYLLILSETDWSPTMMT